MRPPSRTRLVLVALLTVLWLTGCVAVPTKGPIEKVEGQEPACPNCVNIDVSPPGPGDDPLQIVDGYLRATSNYQPNYSVAKQFLTRAAAQKWSPEDGVSIYSGTPAATGSTIVLDGVLIGSLGEDRTYSARDQKLRVNFGLVKEYGEWRISTPPPGLMVEQYSFSSFYQPYNVYFIGNGSVLVPDPIYLPNLRSQSSITSVLMKAMLAGPSEWLQPAVTSAIPANTTLSVDAVTVVDEIADVSLSDTVLQLNDAQRSLMADQVLFTLKQVTGVKGVLFTVNQQPVRIPGGNEANFSVAIDTVPKEVEPIPYGAAAQLYAARDDGVRVYDDGANANESTPLEGPLGTGRVPVDSLAVSVTNTDLAVVTDGRTSLRRCAASGGALTTLVHGSGSLLRPQFTRFNELWTIGTAAHDQRFWVFAGNKRQPVETPLLAGGRVSAFKVSPDGTRIAMVRELGDHSELGLARIIRTDKITVNGWRPLDTSQSTAPEVSRIADLAWFDATDLLVLGSSSTNTMIAPYRISQDASRISADNEPTKWDADELTVLMQPPQTTVVIGRGGQTWKDESSQWLPFADRVRTAAYPG